MHGFIYSFLQKYSFSYNFITYTCTGCIEDDDRNGVQYPDGSHNQCVYDTNLLEETVTLVWTTPLSLLSHNIHMITC